MPGNPKHPANLGNRRARIRIEPSSHLNLLRRQCFRPTSNFPSCPSCLKPGVCSLLNDVPLELSERHKNVKYQFPPEVVVSMFSVRLLKPILRSLSSVMRVMRSFRDLPSRSNFQTTKVSPART